MDLYFRKILNQLLVLVVLNTEYGSSSFDQLLGEKSFFEAKYFHLYQVFPPFFFSMSQTSHE